MNPPVAPPPGGGDPSQQQQGPPPPPDPGPGSAESSNIMFQDMLMQQLSRMSPMEQQALLDELKKRGFDPAVLQQPQGPPENPQVAAPQGGTPEQQGA